MVFLLGLEGYWDTQTKEHRQHKVYPCQNVKPVHTCTWGEQQSSNEKIEDCFTPPIVKQVEPVAESVDPKFCANQNSSKHE